MFLVNINMRTSFCIFVLLISLSHTADTWEYFGCNLSGAKVLLTVDSWRLEQCDVLHLGRSIDWKMVLCGYGQHLNYALLVLRRPRCCKKIPSTFTPDIALCEHPRPSAVFEILTAAPVWYQQLFDHIQNQPDHHFDVQFELQREVSAMSSYYVTTCTKMISCKWIVSNLKYVTEQSTYYGVDECL